MSPPVRLGLLLFLLGAFHPVFAAERYWKDAPLRDYIASLLEQGVHIVYSTDLVLDEYRVLKEPANSDPETALRETLLPYGLTVADGPAGSLLIIADRHARTTVNITVSEADSTYGIFQAGVSIDGADAVQTDTSGNVSVSNIAPGPHKLRVTADGYRRSNILHFTATSRAPVAISVKLEPTPTPLAEIVVTASLYNLRYAESGSHTWLGRDLTTKMPDLGDEALRSITRLPGATSGGISTRSHIRGGVQNEQLFLLDGLRLYEPYHMKDFRSVATIVDPNAIAGIDFYSSGYQARYGDRMSGVVDISLREPPDDTRTELNLSFFNASALSLGRFGGGDRGDWLVSIRRSNLDLLMAAVNPDYGAPKFGDFLTRIGWQLSDRTHVSANALLSYDKITISEADDSVQAAAQYRNNIGWLKADTSWTDALESTTILSATEIDDSRSGTSDRPGILSGMVDDRRIFRSLALKQDWRYTVSDRWALTSGFEIKRLEADYSFASALTILPPFDGILDNQPFEMQNIVISPRGSQFAFYAETRWQPIDPLIIDLGLRWDRQTYTTADEDDQLSPRINVLYKIDRNTNLRIGFGEFYQAQEINELQVADGLTDFHEAQHAEHFVIGLQRDFGDFDLRLELYRKRYSSLMPRFENIFDPLVLIPELQIDRARIDADSAIAKGAEITLSGDRSNDFIWWASYAWSEALDFVQGAGIPRSWDQTHTFNAGFNRDWGQWSFSLAGNVHTGWPRSELLTESTANPDGSTNLAVSVIKRNQQRYGEFQSLDFRVSRRFDVRPGELTAFFEVSNLYNHGNPCCSEYSVGTDDDGDEFLLREDSNWLPLVPSLGVVWRF